MTKSDSAFSWKDGRTPVCKVHSKVKLDLLRSYLLAYFPTVARNPVIDQTRIHLVDAFCGGGVFRDPEQGHSVLGSPLVMASTVAEAEKTIASQRTKAYSIDATYHFADKSRDATERLADTLKNMGWQNRIASGEMMIDTLPFDKFLPKVLGRIPSRSNTKAIFFLDQTGWAYATLNHCNQILKHLPKAEIIWNISIESLAMFANENEAFRKAVRRFGVDLDDAISSSPSYNHYSDWRKALVAVFLQKIRESCLAKYVSPFMVQHEGWGYWLLHLSNHSEANNVMKVTHWRHQNSSLHEGFPGLKMLEFDNANWNQSTLYRFDEDANKATHEALLEQLPSRIKQIGREPTVRALLNGVANDTPADRSRLYGVMADLKADKQLRIRGPNGEHRQKGPQSQDDRLIIPEQKTLFVGSSS